jgi:hypothetical protein
VWDSAAFSSIFLASSFLCSQAESTPAHTQVTQTVRLSPNLLLDRTRAPYNRQTDLKGGGLSPALLIVLADCRARVRSQRVTIARALTLALTCGLQAR